MQTAIDANPPTQAVLAKLMSMSLLNKNQSLSLGNLGSIEL